MDYVKSDPAYKLDSYPTYTPTPSEAEASNRVLADIIRGRNVVARSYNYFNNRQLYDCIDDWTMRWNGATVPLSVLDETSSNIFLNFTRNLIISYLSKIAMQPMTPKIRAVNRKSGIANQHFAETLKDLNEYSLKNENASAKFLAVAEECTVKGTALVYEGYTKFTQKMKTPKSYDMETGQFTWDTEDRLIYDDCYQELMKLEDVYIANPFEPDIQKQPFVIWRKVTSYQEASYQFGHYKNWKYVVPGSYRVLMEPRTYYNEELYTALQDYQTEIYRYYNRKENIYIVMVNGVILYKGPIPFKHGKYPIAKYIFEPFGPDFFWGAGAPYKFMGEQDTQNTFINMMVDKTYGSLLPYGLSSDLDDLIEDDVLAPNKIRKVGDINKWKFDTLPGVSAGEQQMFQTMMDLIRQNSGLADAGGAATPKGGRLSVRQVLLQHQEQMQKISFSMNFLEDGERDRTELRIKNIIQFYSIPKIEKITGKSGKEIESLIYKEARLYDSSLSDGRTGTKIIKMVDDSMMDDNERMTLQNDLSIMEEMGEATGTPTEALAVPISMFDNFDIQVEIVKNSSYERNQTLDQAARQEYAQWRMMMAPYAPVDTAELVKWVDEAYDIDTERFTPKNSAPVDANAGNTPTTPQSPTGTPQPAAEMAPSKTPQLSEMMF